MVVSIVAGLRFNNFSILNQLALAGSAAGLLYGCTRRLIVSCLFCFEFRHKRRATTYLAHDTNNTDIEAVSQGSTSTGTTASSGSYGTPPPPPPPPQRIPPIPRFSPVGNGGPPPHLPSRDSVRDSNASPEGQPH